jgi:predicted metal-dependent HD superfamily phosphohydrolase
VNVRKIVNIVQYIVASKTHTLHGKDNETDLAWFLDFDMSILGGGWEIYLQYMQNLRKEYSVYPDRRYKSGRAKFLQQTLSMEFIFNTDVFRTQYEKQARANMRRELSMHNTV